MKKNTLAESGKNGAVHLKLLKALTKDSFFNMFFEAAPFGIALGGSDGSLIRLNPALCKMLGFSEKELVGKSSSAFTFPDDIARTDVLRENMEAGRPSTYIKRILHKDGSLVLARITNASVLNKDGSVAYSFGIVEDVTHQKSAQFKQSQLAAIVESSSDAIFSITVEGIIQTWNEGAEKIYGYPASWMMRRSVSVLSSESEEDRKAFLDAIESARKGAKSVHLETHHRCQNGNIIPVALTVSPIRSPQGQVEGISLAARDITNFTRTLLALQESEQRMRETSESLRRINEELERFVFVASHDLQEPLRSIACFLKLLEKRNEGRLDTLSEEYLQFAVDGSKRLQQMLLDLLEFSRVSRPNGEKTEVPLGEVLQSTLLDLKGLIDSVDVVINVDPLPTVAGHPSHLRQVFQNLITNAIKFRSANHSKVEVRCEKKDGQWIMHVSDNGIGFSEEFASRVFVIFQRLHTQDEYPGTGVGLAICQKIIERHGGKIWATSRPGEGATFSFSLPILTDFPETTTAPFTVKGLRRQ